MNRERIYQVLIGPHVSEKAAIVADMNNQYVFKVVPDATKFEVKKAVEQLFKVNVTDVRTLKVKGKVKRNRFGYSRKPTWKKAYVQVQQGQDIDFAASE